MSHFKDQRLVKKCGGEVDATEVVSNANAVLLYFSAHWCGPCRNFTPVLKKIHDQIKKDAGVCIIFVSSDGSEEEMIDYFKNHHGDYYAIPFVGTEDLRKQLADDCAIDGIPFLCLVDKQGKIIGEEIMDVRDGADVDALVAKWIKDSKPN